MRHFVSVGGGVNSTAQYIYLALEKGIEFIAVMADHGGDHPNTYKYMEYFNNELIKRGLEPVIMLDVKVKERGMETGLKMYDYCLEKQIVPSMMFRWCTDKFKTAPVNKYINSLLDGGQDEKCYLHIGIAADEEHRAVPPNNPPKWMANKVFVYDFVEDGLTRQDNIDILKRHGFNVPQKSGCYFCPYSKKSELRELYKNDPCLYNKIEELENSVNQKRNANGKNPLYLKGTEPINLIVQAGQVEILLGDTGDFEYLTERKPCTCGL